MPKIYIWVFSLTIVSLLLFLSCTPKTTPDIGLKDRPGPATPVPQKISTETEWGKTIANAKKEGLVTLYGASSIAQARDPFIRAVKEKFGITLDATFAQGAELTTKVMNQRRAGLYLPDVFMGSTRPMAFTLIPQKVFDPLEPHLILPEVKDPSMWFMGRLPIWGSGGEVLASIANITSFIAVNNTLVKPEELTSFRDLLKPKLKGMIIMSDPTSSGSSWFQTAHLFMGPDFFKEFLNQDIVLTRDLRLMQDGLIRGKYALGIGVESSGIRDAIKNGAPLNTLPIFKEGTVIMVGAGNVAVLNNPPHPNVAKVFVNWLLSKEGQTLFSKAVGMASHRLDVPTDHLDPWMVLDDKIKYLWETDEDYMKEQERYFELAKEIFSPLLK